jgi:hypothetical protein
VLGRGGLGDFPFLCDVGGDYAAEAVGGLFECFLRVFAVGMGARKLGKLITGRPSSSRRKVAG